VSLALAIQKDGTLFRVRVGGAEAREWLLNNFHLPADSKVIDTLASAIATKAMQDNLTFFVSFN